MAEPLLMRARYRSKLEERVGAQLREAGVGFLYESPKHIVRYTVPSRVAKYHPDFTIVRDVLPNNAVADRIGVNKPPILIETKGWFKAKDRQKLAFIKEQFPDLDIRLLFQNANNKLYKGSPTTYAKWATDHGFKWADKGIVPDEWLREMKGQANVASRRPRKAH